MRRKGDDIEPEFKAGEGTALLDQGLPGAQQAAALVRGQGIEGGLWRFAAFDLDHGEALRTAPGPGLGAVGPASNYAVLTDFQTWVCTLTMLLGRLELFTLVVLVTPAFWRK